MDEENQENIKSKKIITQKFLEILDNTEIQNLKIIDIEKGQ